MDKDLTELLPPEIAGEYEVSAVLKESAQRRTVLLCRRSDGSRAVLKRVEREAALDSGILEAVRSLKGGGVPGILRVIEKEDAQYILREYVEGKTLLELITERGPLSAGETASVGIKVCGILERLHGLDTPLIHRDIKAENVVLTPEGRCVLIDFGIARFYREADDRDTDVVGTGFAAAPEQFGYAQTDMRSDIYSAGVLLHELSTGHYALDDGRPPAGLRHVVKKCTRFDPADRYQSAGKLKRALSRVKNRPLRLAAALTAAAAILAAALFFALRPAPAEPRKTDVYTFASPALGAETARLLGKEVGEVTYADLGRITAIRLVGEESFDDWDSILIHGNEISVDGRITGAMVRGSVDTLEDIPNFPNLRELALCNQEISDLTPLFGCPVQRLALHGNDISDLTPLAGCTGLLELYISCNPVSDLTALSGIPSLWRLNIGATEITSLETLKEIPRLSYLELMDCPGISNLKTLGELKGLTNLIVRPVTDRDLELIGTLTALRGLGVWDADPLKDLSALSGLSLLRFLFVDGTYLASLEGIQELKALERLDVRSTYSLDAAPLAGLTALSEVNFTCMTSDTGWSEAAGLTNLRTATVAAADEASLRAALSGRDVEIRVEIG